MKKYLLGLVAMCLAGSALAQESAIFSYVSSSATCEMCGFNKKENYNVAIALNNPSLAGNEITAISVPVPATESISDLSVWLTSELKIGKVDGKNVNVPDIASYAAEVPTENADGLPYNFVTVTLPEPVVVPETPIYVGYSFVIDVLDDVTKHPVPLCDGVNPDGFYLYTSRSVKSWMSYSEKAGGVSAIRVLLSAVVPDNGLSVAKVAGAVSEAGKASTVKVEVSNLGSTPVASLDYTVEVGGKSLSRHMDLKTPLPAEYGLAKTLVFETPAVDAPGAYTMTVTVEKVNGVDNDVPHKSAEGTLSVMGYIPQYRPLVEEFTGTGCQYCPRGYASMEYMREKYGNDFVGIAWHKYNTSDPMYVRDYGSLVTGYPACVVNRTLQTDPYYADMNSDAYTFEGFWEQLVEDTVAPVAVEVKGQLSNDCKRVTATATLDWQALPAAGNDVRVEFLLSCDGLTGDTSAWKQVSAYNSTAYEESFLLDQFVGQGSRLDLVYNDCGLLSSGFGGIEGSVPVIEVGQPKDVDFTFALADAVNFSGDFIPQDLAKLNVIALVEVVEKGKVACVLNSAKNQVSVPSGISSSIADPEVVGTDYYNFAGVKVNGDSGALIRVDRLANGSLRTSKLIKK